MVYVYLLALVPDNYDDLMAYMYYVKKGKDYGISVQSHPDHEVY